jgi:hypothetical protein
MEHKDILSPDLVEAPQSPSGEGASSLVAGCMYDEPLGPSGEALGGTYDPDYDLPSGPAGMLYLDRSLLSKGFIRRMEDKYNLRDWDKEKPEHYKVRRMRRKANYYKYERPSKLARDRRLKSTPEGLWSWYRTYVKRKDCEWAITLEEWMDLMGTVVEGVEIQFYDFYVYRIDSSIKLFNLSNITIVDRYSKAILYSPKGL